MRETVYLMQDKESAIDNLEKPYFMRVWDDKNGIWYISPFYQNFNKIL